MIEVVQVGEFQVTTNCSSHCLPVEAEREYFNSYGKARRAVHRVCTHLYWDIAIAVVICLNVICMSMEHYQMDKVRRAHSRSVWTRSAWTENTGGCYVNPLTPNFVYYWGSENWCCSIIIFHQSKVWKATFFMLCDVIFLVRLQGKFGIDLFCE